MSGCLTERHALFSKKEKGIKKTKRKKEISSFKGQLQKSNRRTVKR
jgi:hypothetical protein